MPLTDAIVTMTMMEVLGVDNFGIFDRLGIINHNRSQQLEKESTEEAEEMQKVQFLPFWMPAG